MIVWKCEVRFVFTVFILGYITVVFSPVYTIMCMLCLNVNDRKVKYLKIKTKPYEIWLI